MKNKRGSGEIVNVLVIAFAIMIALYFMAPPTFESVYSGIQTFLANFHLILPNIGPWSPPVAPAPTPAPQPQPTATPTPQPTQQSMTPIDIGVNENAFYTSYKSFYLKPSGAVISNHVSVSWCPNAGIGCDFDTTSEGISRLTRYAIFANDKATFDKEVHFYLNYMKDPNTNHMHWKLNSDLTCSSNGIASAVDAELIFSASLINANSKWGKMDDGTKYTDVLRPMLDMFKTGIYQGQLPFCMYPDHSTNSWRLIPCDAGNTKVFLGYLDFQALQQMCQYDSTFCQIYTNSKNLVISGIKNGGLSTAYEFNGNKYTYENGWIHNLWVIKHLGMDGGTDTWNAVKPFYDYNRNLFMTQNHAMCQGFNPTVGSSIQNACEYAGKASLSVYAVYLEIASTRGDSTFANALISYMNSRIQSDGFSPMAAPDNFGNMMVLESFGQARSKGYLVG